MPNDLEIGRVVAIDTGQVTIELSADLKALTRATYESTVEVGRINSYVIIPVGARKIVAMVTRVVLIEDAEVRADKTMVTLPSARRLVKATMIGTIDGREFAQGIGLFPVLDAPVLIARKDDLEAIFGCKEEEPITCPDEPGFCIEMGHSVPFPDFSVSINPDLFFGKHAAVIGSTGSGKSCTIATIIQSVLARPEVKNTRFIILDTNGEYQTAFPPGQNGAPDPRCLYIPTDPSQGPDRLAIPYWFMDSADFTRLFRASPGIQRPILLDALRLARSPFLPQGQLAEVKDNLITELHRLIAYADKDEKTSKDVDRLATSLLDYAAAHHDPLAQLCDPEQFKTALSAVAAEAKANIDAGTYPKTFAITSRQRIRDAIQPLIDSLVQAEAGQQLPKSSPDRPVYFDKAAFRDDYLNRVFAREEAGAAKARDYCATMLMRMHRLFDDQRFDFLFGPVGGQWPQPLHSLAAFLRDVLGMAPSGVQLSGNEQVQQGLLPYYDRQRDEQTEPKNIVIIDLSLLAAEVLENVTALIGRLILEFLQRASDKTVSGIERGDFPVVLVLEEAQNYIPERRATDDECISRDVFERIAREGRKYGLGLVVASQRPSELSKTVLSQCNSFIVHRLQNPEDLRYFRDIVPGIYEQLLGQLSALAPRHALVLGECVRAPALVQIRECDPVPRSRDPRFYAQWIAENPDLPNVEAICSKWEGTQPADTTASDSNEETDALDPWA